MLQALQSFAAEARATVPWTELAWTVLPFAAFLLCCFQTLSWCFLHVRCDPPPLSEKRKAYFCSLVVSCLSTPFGIYYATRILQPGWDPAEMLETDALSKTLLSLFWTYLLVDMGIGLVAYRHEFGCLSGWVHHIFYAVRTSHSPTSSCNRLIDCPCLIQSTHPPTVPHTPVLPLPRLRQGLLPFLWVHPLDGKFLHPPFRWPAVSLLA